jgi:hypothetical protein
MKNTVGSITTQAKNMAAFCTAAVNNRRHKPLSAMGVLSVVGNALQRPCCAGPADWGKNGGR